MRVCLASAPTITELEEETGAREFQMRRAPLGVLALAAALERGGLSPVVVNLDAVYMGWTAGGGDRGRFPEHAAEQLGRVEADIYGLGTICSSYPATLRIATALKQVRPACRIVLGGPQATATDVATLEAFAAVDFVVRGEADGSFPALVGAIDAGGDPSLVPGLCRRTAGTVARTPDAPLVEDIDSLPLAAYHLGCDLNRAQSLPLEVGRGCPFSCSFCSTSAYFGRRFRMRSPERIVGDMVSLRRAYGIGEFDLVHDNFTVDRRRVLAFCDAVLGADRRFTWTCSSRCDSMDEELLERMWRAGCRGIFFGVESGSAAVQRRIGKKLNLEDARRQLRAAGRRGMPATVAFMAGFPDETPAEVRATVEFFVDTLRFDSLEPQVSLLSPLPGTPIHEQYRHSLYVDDVISDMVYQGVADRDADRELVVSYPEIFSAFYAVPTPWLDRRDLHELRCFLHAARGDLRWLLLSAARVCGGGDEAFRAFHGWRGADTRAWSLRDLEQYYRGEAFAREFVRFARQHLAARAGGARHAIIALATLTAQLVRHPSTDGSPSRPGPRARPRGPALASDLIVSRIGCDGGALLRSVKRGSDLSRVPRHDSGILARRRGRRLEVSHIGAAAAELLALCDGRRDRRSIARAFSTKFPEVAGVSGAQVCDIGLETFERSGVLVRERRQRAG